MLFHPNERIVISIDGANTYAATRSLGIDIDFRKLLAEFQSKTYVSAPSTTPPSRRISARPPCDR